jgi:type IV secretion system protein VirD4
MMADLIATVLEPEPPGDAKNRFFRAGSRNLISLCILWLCELHRDRATLPEISRIIRDPLALEEVLLECAKSEALGAQDKYLPEFRTGAALALRAFSEAGELARVSGPSTFRWRELKTTPTTVYICASLSEARVFGPWLKLVAECAMTEMEFSGGNIPVHFLLDEATNIGFSVAEKMTALRGAGARIHLIFQERSEAQKVWGEHGVQTIYGEVDVEQYFGINDPKLAEDISKRLGTVEVVKTNYHAGANPWDAHNVTSVTERRPLMSAYELMFDMPPTDQILFIRSRKKKLRPVYCQKLSYADVAEWIDMVDDNPVEGGKLRGPPTIRMSYSKSGVRVTKYKRTSPFITWAQIKRASRFLPPLWAAWAAAWLWLGHAAFVKGVSILHSLEFT